MAGPARKLRHLIQSSPRPAVRTELPTFYSSTRIKTLERSEPSQFFFGTTEMNYVCAIVARTTFPNPRQSRRTEPALSASAINDQRMSVLWNQSKLFIKCILTLHSAMISLRLAFAMMVAPAVPVLADEGMWLFTNPPLKQLKEKYRFEPTPQWLEHLQKASVRFNSGGSGSFVSGNGLCITNHHVGADALQKASSQQHNYLKDGFYAKSQTEEIKCGDLELNVLISIEDVTARVNGAVKPSLSPDAASKARDSAMAAIEKESKEKTGFRSDVVTLYQGGVYHLYRYKRYDDVRIVFAPEQQMAFYGGDPDNFEYPRFDLDICFFRVYENGQPAKIDNYLKWNPRGPRDGELTFVSGSPGRTDRQLTVDELADRRDREVSLWLTLFNRREVLLNSWDQRSFENERRARDDIFGGANNRKRYDGYVAALFDPEIWSAI